MLCIYADYKSDESYTPSKISVRVGNNFHNLQEIRVTTLYDINAAWSFINLSNDLLTIFLLLFLSAAVRDGGAQRLDSHLSDESGKKCTALFLFTSKKQISLCIILWLFHLKLNTSFVTDQNVCSTKYMLFTFI